MNITGRQIKAFLLTVLGLDEGDQRLVIWAVILIRDESGIIHGCPGFLSKSNKKKKRNIGKRINVA